jgi:hypothetical protein
MIVWRIFHLRKREQAFQNQTEKLQVPLSTKRPNTDGAGAVQGNAAGAGMNSSPGPPKTLTCPHRIAVNSTVSAPL